MYIYIYIPYRCVFEIHLESMYSWIHSYKIHTYFKKNLDERDILRVRYSTEYIYNTEGAVCEKMCVCVCVLAYILSILSVRI